MTTTQIIAVWAIGVSMAIACIGALFVTEQRNPSPERALVGVALCVNLVAFVVLFLTFVADSVR